MSSQGLSILADYEQKAAKVIYFKSAEEPHEITKKRQDLQQLQNGFNKLLLELNKANIETKYQPYKEIPKSAPPRPENTPKPPEQKVEPIRQQVPPPPRPENTPKPPEQKVEPIRQQVSPPPRPDQLEAKFRNWELDQEIAQMKANMGSPHSQTNQNAKTANPSQNQTEKDKITHAYSILGLLPNASETEIKQAYRVLVKKWHPDLFVNQPQLLKQVQEKMRLINEAYHILSNQ